MTTGRCAAALAAAWLASLSAPAFGGITVEKRDDGAATVARVPLAPRLSLRAHLGTAPRPLDAAPAQPERFGGAGIEYRITRRLVLGAGWEHRSRAGKSDPFDLGLDARGQPGSIDPDRLTLGFSYRF
jgi:hypothetical protein